MDSSRLVALVLIVAGVLILAYGGFSYTRNTTEAKIGSLELNVKEHQTVNFPVWAGVAAIAAGGGLLLMRSRKS
jgi:LPXTG-motif cell wall-anchored protein